VSEIVTLEIPDDLARRARALAAATDRRFEEAVVDWISRAVEEPAVESLPDAPLLALCEATLDAAAQEELSGLLARHREGELADPERQRMDRLMDAYRRGLVLKARALKEAVARGIKPALAGDGA
jgi:hypothetical protein